MLGTYKADHGVLAAREQVLAARMESLQRMSYSNTAGKSYVIVAHTRVSIGWVCPSPLNIAAHGCL